jgi:23S rRNA pseudouridine2605 synthase
VPREKRDFTESKSKSFRKADTEERPQKRSDRDGYNTDKRKSAPTSVKRQAPDYDLKPYDSKKPRGKQQKEEKDDKDTTRLNRYIANAGICSRREADKLIESGEIKVNGKVVTEMGYQVAPNDTVKYGNRVLNKEKLVYVLLNKPKGYITTTDDPEERKTVMDLVNNAGEQRIYPVGRLDRNTSGLLLFTNDGELAEKLAHPSNNIKKIYQVELDKPITKDDFERVAAGVQLEDGLATVDEIAIITPDKITLGIEIHIGRNRIVRRIFEHLGYEVTKLDRVSYAGLTKKDLPRGNWRFLSEKEVIKLKYFV